MPQFPDGFCWGVATSAYQTEGSLTADGRGRSVWDTFCQRPGTIRDGRSAAIATDSYLHRERDVALLAGLGVTHYRFSVAWPRVQPDGRGPVNKAGLDYYDRLTDDLLAAGITPVPTLFHWDLPQALEDADGWLARETAYRFADYAALTAERLADRIGLWYTLNEPFVVAAYGYALGIHAPGRTLMLDALPAVHHLLLGHGLAAAALRGSGAARVSIANNYSPSWPATDSPDDIAATDAYDIVQNRLFTDPVLLGRYPDLRAFGFPDGLDCVRDGDLDVIAAPLDALGVNYYMPARLSALEGSSLPFQLEPVPGYPVTAYGWPVAPAALTELVRALADRYGPNLPPIYLTENGCSADDRLSVNGAVDDQFRIDYLDAHLRALHTTIREGIDVRGYFCWTLADNFEWAEGFTQRFGLVHVDHETQARTPKASYAWYRDMIAGQRIAGQGEETA